MLVRSLVLVPKTDISFKPPQILDEIEQRERDGTAQKRLDRTWDNHRYPLFVVSIQILFI